MGQHSRWAQWTAWSTLCEGHVSCCMMQMVFTPDTDWSTPLPFFKGICDQQIHICIPSHVKSIDQGLYISRIFEIVACCFYIFVQYKSSIDKQ
jgi:hypothetical protein